jgi:hypothetical protein
MLNNDIIIYISNYLLFNEYRNISFVNKIINKTLTNNIPLYIKIEFACNNLKKYPDKLLELFNPIKLYKTPIYKIKNHGCSDYIDFINITNFDNNNFIRGIDKYNRPFISFLFDKTNTLVITLFQRYSDNKYRWVSGGPTPLGKCTIVIDFDHNYEETEEIRHIIDYFNNN